MLTSIEVKGFIEIVKNNDEILAERGMLIKIFLVRVANNNYLGQTIPDFDSVPGSNYYFQNPMGTDELGTSVFQRINEKGTSMEILHEVEVEVPPLSMFGHDSLGVNGGTQGWMKHIEFKVPINDVVHFRAANSGYMDEANLLSQKYMLAGWSNTYRFTGPRLYANIRSRFYDL